MPKPTLRERARRRIQDPSALDAEAWAKEVEEARRAGFELLRFPDGLIVRIRLEI